MRTLKTREAAELLNVSPNTLRAWERRFGYPNPQRTSGRQRLYAHAEIAALRDALAQGLSIRSAVSRVREALSGDSDSLLGALLAFDFERADRAMESALALRTLERVIEELLLPSLDDLATRIGARSATWALAAGWADGWLRRAQRLAPPPVRRLALLFGLATGGELDGDTLAVRALELFCARSGAQVVTLPVASVDGLGNVVGRLAPNAAVVLGNKEHAEVARWTAALSEAGPLPLALFRGPAPTELRTAAGALPLDRGPSAAHHQLLALVESHAPAWHPGTIRGALAGRPIGSAA